MLSHPTQDLGRFSALRDEEIIRLQMAGQPIQMQFRGITDFDIRVDIIHYLQTLNPQDNPEMARPGPRPEGGLLGRERAGLLGTGKGFRPFSDQFHTREAQSTSQCRE